MESPGKGPRAADHSRKPGGSEWLSGLPVNVHRQRAVLQQLLRIVEREDEYRWLELAGSLARGAGDELSDIDAGLGVSEASWPAVLDRTEQRLAEVGPVTDHFRQAMPGQHGDTVWHLVTLYESTGNEPTGNEPTGNESTGNESTGNESTGNESTGNESTGRNDLGVQLSLVVMPASWRPGLPPGAVALYDADGRLGQRWEPSVFRADARTASEWASLAWVELGDLAKNLDRDSGWEAHEALEKARGYVWQLVAYQQDLDYPAFGLTSVLDARSPTLPDGLRCTVAGLDPAELRKAGLALAAVLEQVHGERPPFGDWVVRRLG